MKAIATNLNITSITAKVDGSVRFSASTPELSAEEKTAFFSLQNLNCKAVLQPEGCAGEPMEIKEKLDNKTPSQRMRSVIFIWWKQSGEQEDFDTFYRTKMEMLIDKIKDKLEPEG